MTSAEEDKIQEAIEALMKRYMSISEILQVHHVSWESSGFQNRDALDAWVQCERQMLAIVIKIQALGWVSDPTASVISLIHD